MLNLNNPKDLCWPENRRKKTFVTVLGDLTLKGAYYRDSNGRGYIPRDVTLGLDKESLSDDVKRMIGFSASVLSFRESSRTARRKLESLNWRKGK